MRVMAASDESTIGFFDARGFGFFHIKPIVGVEKPPLFCAQRVNVGTSCSYPGPPVLFGDVNSTFSNWSNMT